MFNLSLMLTVLEKLMTFKPDRIDHGALKDRPVHRIQFGSELGLHLDGAWIPRNSAAAILFIHGNRHNMTRFKEHYDLFHALDISCFTFDFPGYGLSAGSPSEESVYASAHAAYKHVTNSLMFKPEQVIVYGCSLGGAVAIELLQHYSVAGLITESTFTNTHAMGRVLLPYLPVWRLLPRRFENDRKISSITSPHLIIHGESDPLIPVSMAHELFALAREPKHLVTIPGAHHTDALTLGATPLAESIRTFIARCLER